MTDHTTPFRCTSLRVFVVENHTDTMEALVIYLEQLGHKVRGAKSVAEALDLLPREQCDLLLSDIGLPDGTGWELLERACLPPTVYCLAMSGFGANADLSRSKKAGFRHHLLKPFDPEKLDAILEEAASGINPAIARA